MLCLIPLKLYNSSTYFTLQKKDTSPLLKKKTRKDKVSVHWVSYLDGLQRVLLLTQDERIAAKAKKVKPLTLALCRSCAYGENGILLYVVNIQVVLSDVFRS